MGRGQTGKDTVPQTAAAPAEGRPNVYRQLGQLILFGVSLGIYLNTLKCGFVLDDRPAIQENKARLIHNVIDNKSVSGCQSQQLIAL